MQDILREIYDRAYVEKIHSQPLTKEERAVWDKAQEILGENMLDQMLYAQSRAAAEESYDTFRLGFRAGALLMLELVQIQNC